MTKTKKITVFYDCPKVVYPERLQAIENNTLLVGGFTRKTLMVVLTMFWDSCGTDFYCSRRASQRIHTRVF
jgi:hypothetical protein